MVEFVHHDVVKMVSGEALKVRGTVQRLDRGEQHVCFAVPGVTVVTANAGSGHNALEGFLSLEQDFLPVGNEQHAVGTQLLRIKSGEVGLAQASGHDNQSTLVAVCAGFLECFQRGALLIGWCGWLWFRIIASRCDLRNNVRAVLLVPVNPLMG